MATLSVNTQSAQYQQYNTAFNDIIAFYKSRVNVALTLPKEKQLEWRSRDPILDKFFLIYEKIQARVEL